jgi:hypothetical protein
MLTRAGGESSTLAVLSVLIACCSSSCGGDAKRSVTDGTSGGGAVGGTGASAAFAGVSGDAAGNAAQGGANVGATAGRMSVGGDAGSGSGGVSASGGAGGANSGGAEVGAGGAAGTGPGGTGGTPANLCPTVAPPDGQPCLPGALGTSCFYEDCSGAGRSRTLCSSRDLGQGNLQQLWSVETWPCGSEVQCGGNGQGMSCLRGQVCVVLAGGALITGCASHSCGTGPIDCSCVEGCFGECVTSGTENGVTISCNTCSDPRGCA